MTSYPGWVLVPNMSGQLHIAVQEQAAYHILPASSQHTIYHHSTSETLNIL